MAGSPNVRLVRSDAAIELSHRYFEQAAPEQAACFG
jgi:hypothetical protein